jgi:hypothetical protein
MPAWRSPPRPGRPRPRRRPGTCTASRRGRRPRWPPSPPAGRRAGRRAAGPACAMAIRSAATTTGTSNTPAGRTVAIGVQPKRLIGRTAGSMVAVRPLKRGPLVAGGQVQGRGGDRVDLRLRAACWPPAPGPRLAPRRSSSSAACRSAEAFGYKRTPWSYSGRRAFSGAAGSFLEA